MQRYSYCIKTGTNTDFHWALYTFYLSRSLCRSPSVYMHSQIEVQSVEKKFAVGCDNLLALSISFPVAQQENRKEFFTHKRDICCTLPQHSNTHSTTTKMTCTGVLPMWVGLPDTATLHTAPWQTAQRVLL